MRKWPKFKGGMEHQDLEQLELIVTQDFHFNPLLGIYGIPFVP